MKNSYKVIVALLSQLLFINGWAQNKQSPIDINTYNVVRNDKIDLTFTLNPNPTSMKCKLVKYNLNKECNGNNEIRGNIKVGPEKPSYANFLRLNRTNYQFDEFHFHLPGEHKVNGIAAHMEVHFVFKNPNNANDIVVIGLPITANGTDKNSFFQSLLETFKDVRIDFPKDISINLDKLDRPNDKESLKYYLCSFYSYPGSLTTPPYKEGVTWLLAKSNMTITSKQLEDFKNILYEGKPIGHAWCVQRINNRVILSECLCK